MGAQTVVFHPGFYGELAKEETMDRIVKNVRELRNTFVREGWTPRLGMEVMGKRNVFGSLEEVADVCGRVKGLMPVVDFAHIHARGNGALKTKEDFQAVFKKLDALKLKHIHAYFTGVKYMNGNEINHVPIKKGDLDFTPLVEVILENDYNITVTSVSPIVEHDAMYMKILLERVLERRQLGLGDVYKIPEEA
jgi:deoxyribonuclease-4